MIHVVVDTNILRSEGLISSKMQILGRLLDSGDVKLIIPEIILKEYISQEKEAFEKSFSDFTNMIKKLQGRGSINSWELYDTNPLISLWKPVNLTLEQGLNEIETNIKKWFNRDGVEIYSISEIDICELFDNYFSGEGAFSQKKSRNDFPDATIYNSIVRILKDTGELWFICHDGNLKKSARSIKGVNILGSVKELLNLPLLKRKVEELDKNDKRVSSILEYLNDDDCQSKIISYLEKHEIERFKDTFTIENYAEFLFDIPVNPENISNMKVKATEKTFGIDIYFHGKPAYLGDDRFSIPFCSEKESFVSFRCSEEQYQDMPYKLRQLLLFSFDEEGKTAVSGTLNVEYCGVVIIEKVIEEFTGNDLKIHLSYLDSEQCDISCRFVIESLSLHDSSQYVA